MLTHTQYMHSCTVAPTFCYLRTPCIAEDEEEDEDELLFEFGRIFVVAEKELEGCEYGTDAEDDEDDENEDEDEEGGEGEEDDEEEEGKTVCALRSAHKQYNASCTGVRTERTSSMLQL